MLMARSSNEVRGTFLALSLLLAAACEAVTPTIEHMRGGGNAQSKMVQAENKIIRRLIALGGTPDGRLATESCESIVVDAPMNRDGRRTGVVREWSPASAMLDARDSGAAVAIDLQVYAIGGYNGDNELTSVEMCGVDPSDKTNASWSWAPRLRKRRCNLGAAVVDRRRIFAVGGYNGTHDLPNTEFLRVNDKGMPEGEWEWGPTMSHQRSGPAVASMGDRLYAAGGFDGLGLLSTVEEMVDDRWLPIAAMPQGVRGGCAAVCVEGRLYVIGGASGETRLSRVESIDPREGRWATEPSLYTPRAGVAAVAIEDKMQICAAGGYDGNRVLKSVELFDVRMRGSWIQEPAMMSRRWGASMVAVKGRK